MLVQILPLLLLTYYSPTTALTTKNGTFTPGCSAIENEWELFFQPLVVLATPPSCGPTAVLLPLVALPLKMNGNSLEPIRPLLAAKGFLFYFFQHSSRWTWDNQSTVVDFLGTPGLYLVLYFNGSANRGKTTTFGH